MGVSFTIDDESVGAAADDALARMPAAQEGFEGPQTASDPSAPAPSATAPTSTDSALLDSAGVAWDANIHAKGRDGGGVKTADGLWRKRRKSKVGGTKSSADVPAQPAQPGAPVVLTEAQKQQAMQCGVVVAECIFQSFQAFGGKEWEPRVKPIDERANMQGAWGNYFVAKGIIDMPPSLILIVALGGYMLPRFTDHNEFPDTRTRMQRAREWIGVRIDRFKQRRAAAKNQAPATKEIGKKEGSANDNA